MLLTFNGAMKVLAAELTYDLISVEVANPRIDTFLSMSIQDNNYINQEVIQRLENSLNVRKDIFGDTNITVACNLHLLGVCYLKEKDTEQASKALFDALKIRKAIFGQFHLNLAETLELIGLMHKANAKKSLDESYSYNYIDQLDMALSSFKESLNIRLHNSPEITNRLSKVELSIKKQKWLLSISLNLCEISFIQQGKGNFDEAVLSLDHAIYFLSDLDIELKENNDFKHQSIIKIISSSWRCLAQMHELNSDMSKAIHCLEKSMTCPLSAGLYLKEDDAIMGELIDVTRTRLYLAQLYFRQGKYQKSLFYFAGCVQPLSQYFGKNSFEVSLTLLLMGRAYSLNLEEAKAERCLNEGKIILYSIDEQSQLKGLFHQWTALIHEKKGEQNEAFHHYIEAISVFEVVRENTIGDRFIKWFDISLLSSQNCKLRLLECLIKFLKLVNHVVDDESKANEESSFMLHKIGNLLALSKNYDRAMDCFLSVLEFKREGVYVSHLSIADLLFNIGLIYIQQNENNRAFNCHKETYKILSGKLGAKNIELLEIVISLGNISLTICQYDEAKHYYEEGLQMLSKVWGGNYFKVRSFLLLQKVPFD